MEMHPEFVLHNNFHKDVVVIEVANGKKASEAEEEAAAAAVTAGISSFLHKDALGNLSLTDTSNDDDAKQISSSSTYSVLFYPHITTPEIYESFNLEFSSSPSGIIQELNKSFLAVDQCSLLNVLVPLVKFCSFNKLKNGSSYLQSDSLCLTSPRLHYSSSSSNLIISLPVCANNSNNKSNSSQILPPQRVDSGYHENSDNDLFDDAYSEFVTPKTQIITFTEEYLSMQTNHNNFTNIEFDQNEKEIFVKLTCSFLDPSIVNVNFSTQEMLQNKFNSQSTTCFVSIFGFMMQFDNNNNNDNDDDDEEEEEENDEVNKSTNNTISAIHCSTTTTPPSPQPQPSPTTNELNLCLTKTKSLLWKTIKYRCRATDNWNVWNFQTKTHAESIIVVDSVVKNEVEHEESAMNKSNGNASSCNNNNKTKTKKNGKVKKKNKNKESNKKGTFATYKENKLRNAEIIAEEKEIFKNMEPIEVMSVPDVEFTNTTHLQCSSILKRSESVSSAGDDTLSHNWLQVSEEEINQLTDHLMKLNTSSPPAEETSSNEIVVVSSSYRNQRTYSTSSNKSVTFTKELVDMTFYHYSESVLQLHKRLTNRRKNQRKKGDKRQRRSSHSNSVSMDGGDDDAKMGSFQTNAAAGGGGSGVEPRYRSFSESEVSWILPAEAAGGPGGRFVLSTTQKTSMTTTPAAIKTDDNDDNNVEEEEVDGFSPDMDVVYEIDGD